MVKYCAAALLVMLAWLMPGTAWANPVAPLLAQSASVEVVDVTPAAISDSEIPTFARVYQKVQLLRLRAEQEMAKAVEDEGLSIERFNAIAETQLTGAAESPDDMAKVAERAKISKKEDKQFKAAVDRIIAIRQSTEAEMEKAIEADGLAIDTFNSILEQSADDTDLQRKISDEIVKQTLVTADSAAQAE
ncbi:DUF4168 domain-containing protein [Nodosilinea sp. LEGE 06152]|uniref:DUF4168 domain-containing protein n=1 Tax=Nodosilinea sp. LEGE 06152 TaxID=2777966 RepID=UPI001880F9CC|nr:DUF4168 domain-containing protein [Nodosilinea sp. LEGE 06152]MBE9159489.1 DUF4168 domain-containing protein [Nodosilinea sp. LEGE 06152]